MFSPARAATSTACGSTRASAIALLLFLPNLIWLARHDFISYTFLQHIHARDVGEGRAEGYWKYQFLFDANLFATPLWIAGLVAFFRSSRYRMLAWMYVVPVLIFWLNKGRFYYVAEAYPALDRDGLRGRHALAGAASRLGSLVPFPPSTSRASPFAAPTSRPSSFP